ncbi:hypothetical protein BH23ACT12_BH23ACT12_04840 [soil metagenome]
MGESTNDYSVTRSTDELGEQFNASRQRPEVELRFAKLAERLGVKNYTPASVRETDRTGQHFGKR